MFTGIIEEVGTVKGFAINGSSGRIKIKAKKVLEGTKLGDSIAVNGVCLTVVTMQSDGLKRMLPERLLTEADLQS